MVKPLEEYPAVVLNRCYWNPLSILPLHGSEGTAKAVVAYSFGRRSPPDRALDLCHTTLEAYEHSVLDALGFMTSHWDPGSVNDGIARSARYYLRTYRYPLVLQWEIALSLYKTDRFWFEERWRREKIFCLWPKPNATSYRTIEVLRDAKEILDENGW